jgi:phage shock protein PspC (stress-responsive transcriptional regulator)
MQAYQPNLFTRDDTFFGVCEALGEDFGFPPILLRLPLGIAVLWNPVIILSAYFGAGILIFLTRRLYPNARRAAAAQPAAAGAPAPVAGQARGEMEPELLAAAA